MADINASKLSINPDEMKLTSFMIEESGENIKEAYNVLVEVNEMLLAELNGDISTDFCNAANRIEAALRSVYSKFIKTSAITSEYTYSLLHIDTNAEHLAGGYQNE